VAPRYPGAGIETFSVPGGKFAMVNVPSDAVVVESVVPSTVTVTPASGSPVVTSVAFPLMVRDCAPAAAAASQARAASAHVVFMVVPSYEWSAAAQADVPAILDRRGVRPWGARGESPI